MSQIITYPTEEHPLYRSVFLAGTAGDRDWRSLTIWELERRNEKITVLNPGPPRFTPGSSGPCSGQKEWEFGYTEKTDIFSMYFCREDTDDYPVRMYELGRNILRMQIRFPNSWEKRIVIGIENGCVHRKEIMAQILMSAPMLFVDTDASPETHGQRIRTALIKVGNSPDC